MKNVLILHGTDSTPDQEGSYWFPWLASELTSAGYHVAVPHLPNINHESADATIQQLKETHPDAPDILVTHSAGGPLALALLQGGWAVQKTVMVAGFHRELAKPGDNPVLQEAYDWPTIKQNGGDFAYFNSVNDPWGCNDVQGREMFDQTGGVQIVMEDGHFGSTSFNQPYQTFPLLRDIIVN
jgi:uncharacterized protein